MLPSRIREAQVRGQSLTDKLSFAVIFQSFRVFEEEKEGCGTDLREPRWRKLLNGSKLGNFMNEPTGHELMLFISLDQLFYFKNKIMRVFETRI